MDWTPGLESFLAECPSDPQMRDSASLWIMDERGEIALPRVTIDAIGSRWDRPALQINIVLADGRALRVWNDAQRDSPTGLRGSRSVLSAGRLRFECIEPFRRWTLEFEGLADQSTTAAQMAGRSGGTPVEVAFRFDAQMAAPPWLMGAMTAEAARMLRSSTEGAQMGGVRYEQLCRVTGSVSLTGEEYHIFGTGMRVRRQGVRNMGTATGHSQHSALFPSGRAIGAIAFAPRPDGAPSFNEAFLFTGEGGLIPARVVQAPWMTRLLANGEDVPLVLQSALGDIQIDSQTLLSTFDHNLFEMADTAVLQQGVARYVWDGEETVGLIERCTHRNQLEDFK